MTDRPYFVHESAYVDEPCEIGEGTKIWHFCHVMKGARLGRGCVLGQNVNIANDVVIGSNVKIQNNVSVYTGTIIEDDVFLGPSCVLTNVSNPRSQVNRHALYEKTLLRRGCSIGANATIVCGVTVGRYAFVAAGAVLAAALLYLSSAAMSAAYVFVCAVLSIVFADPRYAAVAAAGLALAVLISHGHMLRVIRNYVFAIEYWPAPRGGAWSPVRQASRLAVMTSSGTEQPPQIAVLGCGYWGRDLVSNFQAIGAPATVCDAAADGRVVDLR